MKYGRIGGKVDVRLVMVTGGAFALATGPVLQEKASAQQMLEADAPVVVPIGDEWQASGFRWGRNCLRIDTVAGQAYQVIAETTDPSQKWAVVNLKSGERCTEKDLHTKYAKGESVLEFQAAGGSYFVEVKSQPGDLQVKIVTTDKRKLYRLKAGLDLPPVSKTVIAAAPKPVQQAAQPLAEGAKPVQQAAVAEQTQPTTPPAPAGALRYTGGIANIALGQEITGNTRDGTMLAKGGGPAALMKFEGVKGQEVCLRTSGPEGALTTLYMEYVKKGEPRLIPGYGTYPTDPMMKTVGGAMRVTLPKTGTYYLWPRLARAPEGLYAYNSITYPDSFEGKFFNGEFSVKLWDPRMPEPASLSETMRAADRPTYVNGFNMGVMLAALDGPMVTRKRDIFTDELTDDGAIIRRYKSLVNGNTLTTRLVPNRSTGRIDGHETYSDGTIRNYSLPLNCDGNAISRSGYQDNIQAITSLDYSRGILGTPISDPGPVLVRGGYSLMDDERPSFAPRWVWHWESDIVPATPNNIRFQLEYADYNDREEQKLRVAEAQNRREEAARRERVWAGIMGELGKVGDYVAQNQTNTSSQNAYQSPYQGLKTMDKETAARTAQLAQSYAASGGQRRPDSGPGGRRDDDRRDDDGREVRKDLASNSGTKGGGSGITITAGDPKPAPAQPDDPEVTVYRACIWRDSLWALPGRMVYSRIGSMKTTQEKYVQEINAWQTRSLEAFEKLNGKPMYINCPSSKDRAVVQRQLDEQADYWRNHKFSVTPVGWSP